MCVCGKHLHLFKNFETTGDNQYSYNDHPKVPVKVAFMDTWSLYTGLNISWDIILLAFISRCQLYRGGL